MQLQNVDGVGFWSEIGGAVSGFLDSGLGSALVNIGTEFAKAEIVTAVGPKSSGGTQTTTRPATQPIQPVQTMQPQYVNSAGQPIFYTAQPGQPGSVPNTFPTAQPVQQASMFSNPTNIAMIIGGAALLILLLRR